MNAPADCTDPRHAGNGAPYLLGALPELETQAFERHVMGCASCRDELELLRPAVEALPRSVSPVEPPARLKRTLMREVQADARPTRTSLARRALERFHGSGLRIRPAMAWVSAVILVLFGGALGFGIGEFAGPPEATTLTAAVDARRAQLGTASLTVLGDGQRGGLLSVHGMPVLPSSRSNEVYQLWLDRAGEVIPVSTFSVGDDGSGFGTITSNLDGVDRVMVTREPAGGADVPSEKPIIDVTL